jgi:hypothetical protein
MYWQIDVSAQREKAQLAADVLHFCLAARTPLMCEVQLCTRPSEI